jgi:hypothetical protein
VDPDGRENSSWLSDQEEEDKKALQYSQAPQLIEYVYMEYDYTLFAWYCIISGVILGAIGIKVFAPYLISFAKTLVSYGHIVANKVIGILNKLSSSLLVFGKSDIGKLIIVLLLAVATYIAAQVYKGKNPDEIDVEWIFDEEGNIIGVNMINEWLCGIPIAGKVEFYEGPSYNWKLSGGKYYIQIDGEWVEMPEGWKPGDPIPEDN